MQIRIGLMNSCLRTLCELTKITKVVDTQKNGIQSTRTSLGGNMVSTKASTSKQTDGRITHKKGILYWN